MNDEVEVVMTSAETQQFTKLDSVIKKGAKTFMEVGQALVEMHAGKLYRARFGTFEEYAASRGIGRQRAYELMSAVQLSLELGNVRHDGHDGTPVNIEILDRASEKALRKLKSVTPGKRKKVLLAAAAKSTGPVTAKAIEVEAARIDHKPMLRMKEEPESGGMLDAKAFQKALDGLVARIPDDGNHDTYGTMLYKAATVQMNFGRRTSLSAYG